MVFIADFTAIALTQNISEILKKIRTLSFVLECNPTKLLPVIQNPDDPIHCKTPATPQQTLIEGSLYGNYVGIKEVFGDIIKSVDGVQKVVVSIRESSAMTKYTLISGLVTASVVFAIILLTQLDIDYQKIIDNVSTIYPILAGAILGFCGSLIIEFLILTKERMRQ